MEWAAHLGNAGLAQVHLALGGAVFGGACVRRVIADYHARRLLLLVANLLVSVVTRGVGACLLRLLLLLLELDGLVEMALSGCFCASSLRDQGVLFTFNTLGSGCDTD